MKALLKNPWIVGISSLFISLSLGHFFAELAWGSIKCSDGWASSSIGTSGACSHHGGVDKTRDIVIGFISIAVAVIAARLASNLEASGTILRGRDERPSSPYGSKNKHREILLASGAKIEQIETVLSQYADD